MTAKERILNLYNKKYSPQVGLAAYLGSVPSGETERTLRKLGLILVQLCSPYIIENRNVEEETRKIDIGVSWINCIGQQGQALQPYKKAWRRTYHTPIGSVSEKVIRDSAYGTSDWKIEYLIKKPSDYRIVKYMIENCTYFENYEAIRQAQDDLGDDGIVLSAQERSPLQRLILEYTGLERFCLDYYDHRDLVEEVLLAIEKNDRINYHIGINSPAEVIWAPDNIAEDIANPKLYQKYLLAFYNEQARLIHKSRKIYAVHIDGRVQQLADLISQTDIDVVDSFTLPEGGGNLPLMQARETWRNKTIVANIPASLAFRDSDYIRKFVKKLKKEVAPQNNFMLQYSEDIPRVGLKKILCTIAEVLTEDVPKK